MLKVIDDFDELFDEFEEIPFIVCIGTVTMLGVTGEAVKDFFVARIREKGRSLKYGNIEIMDMSRPARRWFLQNIKLFQIVQDDQDGQVYEVEDSIGYFKAKLKQKNRRHAFSKTSL